MHSAPVSISPLPSAHSELMLVSVVGRWSFRAAGTVESSVGMGSFVVLGGRGARVAPQPFPRRGTGLRRLRSEGKATALRIKDKPKVVSGIW